MDNNVTVLEPEIKKPTTVIDTLGKTRKTRLSDFEDVWDFACKLKACWMRNDEIQKQVLHKFGLVFPIRTYESMTKCKTYTPRIDRYRKNFAVAKLRDIPYAYKFKRVEKLSQAMESAKDPRDIHFLDKSLFMEMERAEDALYNSTADADMSPDAKKKFILDTAIKLLSDPVLDTKHLENQILKAADKIRKMREIQNADIEEAITESINPN